MENATPPRLTYERLELPAVLGVSVATIDKLIKNGTLPGRKLGRRVVVPRSAVERFLDGDRAA